MHKKITEIKRTFNSSDKGYDWLTRCCSNQCRELCDQARKQNVTEKAMVTGQFEHCLRGMGAWGGVEHCCMGTLFMYVFPNLSLIWLKQM